jgi:hypothetical protein
VPSNTICPPRSPGPGAHVDQAVGGEHHRRVVLDHHQRVAGIAQAVHGLDDAVHVARVQADAGLVQHEQRVHQRGAQRGGEVDALHLAAADSVRLWRSSVEVAQADVAQVLQRACGSRPAAASGPRPAARWAASRRVEEAAQALDRQAA